MCIDIYAGSNVPEYIFQGERGNQVKPRKRQLSHLYFRYGQQLGLSANECADALESAGLIQREGLNAYREAEGPKMPLDEYEAKMITVLKIYKRENL